MTEIFVKSQQVLSQALTPVHPAYRWLLGGQVSVYCLVLASLAIGFWFFVPQVEVLYSLLALGVIGLFWALLFFLWAPRRYRVTAYAVCEGYLVFVVGAFWYTKTSLPFNRLQHLEIAQSPLERIFKIYRLVLYTAGGATANLAIPGLEQLEAEALREKLLQVLKEEVLDSDSEFKAGT